MQGLDGELVTPEGVVLDLAPADVASRVLARTLDLVVCGTALYAVLIGVAAVSPPIWLLIVVITVAVFLGVFVYPAVLEATWRGRTVGKAATGLRVVTETGGPIGVRHAATRSALSVVDLLTVAGFVGMASILLSSRRQRLGDLAAGTIVVRTRDPRRVSSNRFAVPVEYEAFASSLETPVLEPGEVVLARDVLRAAQAKSPHDVEPHARALALHLDAKLGSRRPELMPAQTFLQCVVVQDARTTRSARPLRPAPAS